jgi:hypothetical protein
VRGPGAVHIVPERAGVACAFLQGGRAGRNLQDHIETIAALIRSLTYGEMIELVSELQKTAGETIEIDKIAELIRSLTYGEMIELASGLQEAAGGAEITAGTLPMVLHRWACEHGK